MSAADGDAGSEPWEPLSAVDVVILGIVGTLQTFALVICVHLLWWRKWPPYVTKNPPLVVIAAVSGVLWALAMAVSCGFVRLEAGDILASCDLQRFLVWSTLAVHTVAFSIRVYRMWRILIKHDSNMWHTGQQVLLVSSVSLFPLVVTWGVRRSGYFDENANACIMTTFSGWVVLGMVFLGFLAICFLWFVCARQLKSVRKQFNEYESMKRSLLLMTITLASYMVGVIHLLAEDRVLQRRVAIFYPMLTTYVLLWGSIREPLAMKMLGDKAYLWSYTKGFAELPSPAQLKSSLAEQLSVDQLRQEFRRYIKTRVAQELVDFYLDSLDREEVTGFFERQAATMHIIERYIREGAPDQVNISEECREKTLATDVTAFDIFDEARKEVLAVMETNFRRDFVTTEGFQRIVDASEEEQRELRVLRAGGILLPGTPSTPGSVAEITPPAPSSLAAGNRRMQPPESAPFLEGIVDTFKRLPFLVRNATKASEARRRQGQGAGGSRPRISADDIGASGNGMRHRDEEAQAPVEEYDFYFARRLQREEDAIGLEVARRVARNEAGGAPAVAPPAAVYRRC